MQRGCFVSTHSLTMDVDHEPAGPPLVSRDKTAPFLIRTFAKVGGFHRLGLFEDGTLRTTDEHQLFTTGNKRTSAKVIGP
ncbi:hypothetical protein DFP72DRAFT_909018 [Ephemerocybe angulata]|uniref:Uncharacterized protein n=1 Tax=Ephemerocybe angulata TaxID=980116 RepID=A0A8H6M4B9_9AGAR|nr:hypothetical protein DFP72DRAFT_909018 [Tulosesus angulatus]